MNVTKRNDLLPPSYSSTTTEENIKTGANVNSHEMGIQDGQRNNIGNAVSLGQMDKLNNLNLASAITMQALKNQQPDSINPIQVSPQLKVLSFKPVCGSSWSGEFQFVPGSIISPALNDRLTVSSLQERFDQLNNVIMDYNVFFSRPYVNAGIMITIVLAVVITIPSLLLNCYDKNSYTWKYGNNAPKPQGIACETVISTFIPLMTFGSVIILIFGTVRWQVTQGRRNSALQKIISEWNSKDLSSLGVSWRFRSSIWSLYDVYYGPSSKRFAGSNTIGTIGPKSWLDVEIYERQRT